jgi:hypothetical protein
MPRTVPANHPIDALLTQRFSPYVFDPERSVERAELASLFEAARWTMSCYNEQPFVTARYGDYVLLRPPLRAGTLALWFGPVGLLLAAVAAMMLRRRRVAAEPFSAEEDRRFAQLLDHERAP